MAAAMLMGSDPASSRVSVPRAMTVVHASICFRSVWRTAHRAPTTAVTAPASVRLHTQISLPPRLGDRRASR